MPAGAHRIGNYHHSMSVGVAKGHTGYCNNDPWNPTFHRQGVGVSLIRRDNTVIGGQRGCSRGSLAGHASQLDILDSCYAVQQGDNLGSDVIVRLQRAQIKYVLGGRPLASP